jgi:outer membrane protein
MHRLTTSLSLLSLCLTAPVLAAGQSGTFDPFDTQAAVAPQPCTRPQISGALGLADVVDLALCNNPQTREAWANARVQAGLVGVAQAPYLPSLTGTVGNNRLRVKTEGQDANNKTLNSATLSLSWLLYDFGVREANLESARQLLSAAVATQDSTSQQVFLAALQAYYQVHALQAALDAAELSEKAARESLAAAEARYRAGSATPADRLQAQTALSQATLTRIRVGGELKNARGALANAIGLDANRPVQLATMRTLMPPTDFEQNVDTLIDEARRRRPDLTSAEAQLKAAQASVDANRAAHLPSFSLAATPNWVDSSGLTTNTSNIGVSVTIPIFTGFSQTYKVRTAEAQAELKAAQRDRLQLQVALDVWKSYQSLITSQTVSANGTLNPVVLVNVGTQVSGTVTQALRRLQRQGRKRARRCSNSTTRCSPRRPAERRPTSATSQATLELARANEARMKALFAQEYVSRQELDQAVQARKSAEAQLAQAQARRTRTGQPQYTTIRSPVSGVVVDRVVDLGQTVAASLQTPTLIKIAQDLSEMRIDSSFAEADIGKIREGRRCASPSTPSRTQFPGRGAADSPEPDDQQNVVTYNVRVSLPTRNRSCCRA